MKVYEEIDLLEKNIIRAKEQAHFLRCTLISVDTAIQTKKQKLEEDIAEYNERANNEEKVLKMYEDNIATWTNKLDKLYSKQIKKIDKEKVVVVVEKSEKQLRKELLKSKKAQIAKDLQKAKDQLNMIEATVELEKEEVSLAVDFIKIEPDTNKVNCPECGKSYTKGGAFAAHYKSHLPNSNGKE